MLPQAEVTFRNLNRSGAVEEIVRRKFGKVQEIFGADSCHVVIDSPHRHHHRGNCFNVRIDLDRYGKKYVVPYNIVDPEQTVYGVVTEAFEVLERRLRKDHERRTR